MNDKIKNIVVTVVFCIFIFGFFIINLIKAPTEISVSERRKLEQMPKFTKESVMDASFMNKFETYVLNQFAFRDDFRKIKAFAMYNIFRRSDNNGIYVVNDQVSKYVEKFNEAVVKKTSQQYNKLYESLLSNMNVYYSIIPDKNYYIAEKNGYPHIDYESFKNIVNSTVNENIKYIDLFDTLDVNDYYKTDTHWRQEKISKVVEKLANEMNFEVGTDYKEHSLDNFYGVYYGQSALPIDLTNETLDNAKVQRYIYSGDRMLVEDMKMYDEKKFKNVDPYDLFLRWTRNANNN